AAWDVGRLPIRFADILVRQSGEVTRVPVGRELAVEVTSVLPADSAARIPQPPRALFVFGPPWWLWLLVGAAALGLLWVIWHWRRRHVTPRAPARTAYEAAQEEFARVASLDLIASGERGHFVALMTDVVRAYLARVFPAAPQALTTSELLQALRGEGRVALARLSRVLHDADLVKFAGRAVDAERAIEVGDEARAIVDAVEAALGPPSQREAA
ncbi:MAG: hypothetical protein ABIZ91_09105, partial [Gemmatimonadaceae bacterium]